MNANPAARIEKQALTSADQRDNTLPKSPYTGIQFVAIPEFQAIGTAVGQQMAAVLGGGQSVEAALAASQKAAERKMREAAYFR